VALAQKEPLGVGATTQANGMIHLPKPGPIFDLSGKSLGRHRGLAYYTIGQRKGLGITSLEPLHVLKIDSEQNALIVGPAKELEKTSCTVAKMHYISGETPSEPFKALARIRYKAPEQEAVVTLLDGQCAHVTFSRPQRAITPGQAAVFYGGEDGDEVLCGGIIE
jgi:tRNA-specific 2-thiouridylase